MTFSKKDVEFLKTEDKNCFVVIKKLWEVASKPSGLDLIKEYFSVVDISEGLTLKDPFAVKGITSVLLFWAAKEPNAPEDFINDDFFDKYYNAIQDEDNEVNYLLLARLIRMLQINKAFGDWMLNEKGVVRSVGTKHFFENRIWDRLYEISKDEKMEDDVRKETGRAVKEGTRVGAVPGQHCIIPDKNVDRLQKEAIWSLTEADSIRLDKCAKEYKKNLTLTDEEDTRPLELRIGELNIENEYLKKNAEEKLALLKEKIEEERANKEDVVEKLQQARQELKELTDRERDELNPNQPSVNVSHLGDLQENMVGLASQVKALRENILQAKQAVIDLAEEVVLLRNMNINKSNEIIKLKTELHTFISESLQEVLDSVVPIIQAKISGGDGSAIPTTPSAALPRTLTSGPPTTSSLSASPPSFSSSSSSSSSSPPSVHASRSASSLTSSSPAGSPGKIMGTPSSPSVDDVPLPPGWDKKLDPQTNRYYYINRATKKTQWKPPVDASK